MHLLSALEQTWPVLLLELLLPQHQLDIAGRVVDLALGRVDLGVELQLDVVGFLFRLRVARECEFVGLEIELQVFGVHVCGRDGEEDVVLGRVCAGRALCPENWRTDGLALVYDESS
jgi:hypothetical protein